MREQVVGTFNIGYEGVRLVIREGIGGEFTTNPVPTIWIGIQSSDWSLVWEALLHETTEFVAFRLGARYVPDNSMSSDHGAYFFAYNHSTFSDICAKVALFTIPVLPLLRTAWEAYHNPRKTRRR
jgi:hypothetical protein